ncbi:hypothetical protein CBS147333_8155 [Penicillium roqueforti]|nr:hypothetical protein CBS147333_8155 [Penicillium roqueforti]KAI3198648.1 hypothetical protein CBS147311_6327 [Penicillium roqueforti]KAI3266684.1 hypothetical protein CBS147308_6863 [Penicillium roqueforti]KAI3288228.1 hypothetical protein DTO003C3_5832 [Penicillium roqueforti]
MNPDSMDDHSMQDDMERPAKRPCLSYTPTEDDEVPAEFDLPAARAQNDSRLKSLFEHIFAKYSKDFTDVGDEIDLQTGDIVVDNGHLLGMRSEHDAGQPRSWLSQGDLEDPDADDDTAKGEEDEFFSMASSPGRSSAPREESPSKQLQTDMDTSLDFVFTFKSSGTAGHSPTTKEEQASHPTNPSLPSKPQDSIWAVPDLPASFSTPTTETRKTNAGFSSPATATARSPSPPGSGSIWAVRRPRKPRTETKPKATPSKRQPAAKRKYHSSPVTRDWSFAEVPDGNESDDPLQDYEPSPTPSRVKIIRGKRRVPTKVNDGPSTPSKRPTVVIEVERGDRQEGGCGLSGHAAEVADAHLEERGYELSGGDEVPDTHLEEGGCESSNQVDEVRQSINVSEARKSPRRSDHMSDHQERSVAATWMKAHLHEQWNQSRFVREYRATFGRSRTYITLKRWMDEKENSQAKRCIVIPKVPVTCLHETLSNDSSSSPTLGLSNGKLRVPSTFQNGPPEESKRRWDVAPIKIESGLSSLPEACPEEEEPSIQVDEVPEVRPEEECCEPSHQEDEVPEEQLRDYEPNDEENEVTEEQLQGGCEQNDQNETSGSEYKNELPCNPMVHDSTPKTTASMASSPQPENTPSKRQPITPDEAKLIVCMMHKQEKKASDVMHMLPGREYPTVWHWFYNHWTRRLANPPPLSAAWSQPELVSLSRLSTQSGLTWGQIQSRFKGRSRHEVEFELLRAFVGEGFPSAMVGNIEEQAEPEELPAELQPEEMQDEINNEPGSEAAMQQAPDEVGGSNAACEDIAQEELKQLGIQEVTNATDMQPDYTNTASD